VGLCAHAVERAPGFLFAVAEPSKRAKGLRVHLCGNRIDGAPVPAAIGVAKVEIGRSMTGEMS
jgi:hypothetical protein